MSPPEPTRPTPGPPEPRRISDSPLFWFFMFGAMGLLALVAIAPKHAQRQERLERMADSRQRPFAARSGPVGSRRTAVRRAAACRCRSVPRRDAIAGRIAATGRSSRVALVVALDDLPGGRISALVAAAVGTARYLRLAETRAEGQNRARPSSKEQP